ncbi:hypothetical protein KC19_5G044400 [Ceratodon purpureus]|uniref:pyruvate dehydrogenase (acetyl-transferring) n=1 Tax=Ceratodon purpureus TaxID=3225 RepID=A0A8T0HZ65_CERPU|nr:hypothetical protein KC19_5G044400 [Ceratodon purpureus]
MNGSRSMLRLATAALRQGSSLPGSAGKGAYCKTEFLVRGYAADADAYDKMPDSGKKPDSGEIVVEIPVKFNLHLLESGPPQEAITTKEELMKSYTDMSVIRRAEISADMLFKSQMIRGFCHLYDGQEAVAVGMERALTFDDSVITAYRDHGIFLGRGGTALELFSELMGKKTGCALGKGGSMHLYHRKHNFWGGWGIVGSVPPLGAGLAFAHKYMKKPNVVVAIYGDGAGNQGQLYEAQNLAALWNLPLILLIENNHFGMGTAEWRASKKVTHYDRVPYIPGIKADGMDMFSVREAFKYCKEHCLAGKGPIMLEADTYRYHGHSMSDPGSTYRSRKEIQGMRQERDPIERIRKIILTEELVTKEELKDLDKKIRAEVEDAAAKAREEPFPSDDELFANIYKADSGLVAYGCDRRKTKVEMP